MGFSLRMVALLLVLGTAAGGSSQALAAAEEYLAPQQAFSYSLQSDGQELVVRWTVAPGYYLYRKRLGVETTASWARLGEAIYPTGEKHSDEYFGEQEVYRGSFEVRMPLQRTAEGLAANRLPLILRSQGCADAGLCYPPQRWEAEAALPTTTGLLDRLRGSLSSGTASPASAGSGSDEFLPVDQAFRIDALADGPDKLRIRFAVTPGYYLYKNRLKVTTPGTDVLLGAPSIPRGKDKTDEYFGTQEVFDADVVITVPVSRAAGAALELPVEVGFQGCAEAGLCYPPETRGFTVTLPAGAGTAVAGTPPGAFVSEQDRLARLIGSGQLLVVLGTFFGLGLLLAFTPCVLPMVPILSGIIAGQGASITTRRAFALSLTYVLGMALMNTLAGVAAAAAGQQVQAAFQQPWVIVLFAALFVALALSMFGLFTLQVPAALQTRLAMASGQQRAGSFAGVAIMGALSALIVSACVAPPLFAALAVISQTGDLLRGGSALFAMSIGMGVPLLVVGTSAGRLLPRAGAWMDTVKNLFGVLMLGVAAWMLARIVPERWALVIWAIPALAGAALLWRGAWPSSTGGWALRGLGTALGVWALALLAGAALGGRDPLSPIPQLAGEHRGLEFRRIRSLQDLEREVAAAAAAKRPVMLDFYADWCVSCKEMEKYTFTNPAVLATLSNAVLLQADVTENNADDQALLRRFAIFGPPTIAFYGPDGAERARFRVVGFMKAEEFAVVAGKGIAGL